MAALGCVLTDAILVVDRQECLRKQTLQIPG
jgi:hypothetical protein